MGGAIVYTDIMVQHKTSFAIVSDFNSPEETESIVKKHCCIQWIYGRIS